MMDGTEGVNGFTFIIISADAGEVQPAEFVTVKLCVPEVKPDSVLLDPVPVIAPGLIIQLPVGRPLNTTLPVAKKHVGCVIAPAIGAEGVTGWVFITMLPEAGEAHPVAFVTVYVPDSSNRLHQKI